jgi:hypothetical protein
VRAHLKGYPDERSGIEGQALQRQRFRSGRTNRVALTHLHRSNSDFRHWRICQSPEGVFDPASNCAAGAGMRMGPVVAHAEMVTIWVCDACPSFHFFPAPMKKLLEPPDGSARAT